jgi:hypothetical protein
MKAYLGSCVAPLILNLSTRWRWVVNITPRSLYPWERTPVLIALETGWALELVWTIWNAEKFLVRYFQRKFKNRIWFNLFEPRKA